MFTVSEAWKERYPGAAVGVLVLGAVTNPRRHRDLEQRKQALESDLRARYAGFDRARVKALPTIQAYNNYYKRFKKSYHVQLQLESVLFKNKPIPSVAALVEAMFMAELNNLLLTAGHHMGSVEPPVGIDVAVGGEQYTKISGQEQQLKAGDMFIADRLGVISSVLYGPDHRTRILPETEKVIFTVYAPPGIEEQLVYDHLDDLKENVILVAPDAQLESLDVYGTG